MSFAPLMAFCSRDIGFAACLLAEVNNTKLTILAFRSRVPRTSNMAYDRRKSFVISQHPHRTC